MKHQCIATLIYAKFEFHSTLSLRCVHIVATELNRTVLN